MSQTIGPVTSQKGPVCLAGGFGPVYGPGTPAFVLDQLSAFPAVAFSVRQLTAGQSARPYCLLVRRSSDNATLKIGYFNGLLDTTSLLAFVGSGNGFVVTWYNQGSLGSAGDATQSTAASQPQIVANGVVETQNGVPTVYFGGSQSLNGPAIVPSNGVFLVGFANSTNTNNYADYYSFPNGSLIRYFSSGVVVLFAYSTSTSSYYQTNNGSYVVPSGLKIHGAAITNSAQNLYVNGSLIASSTFGLTLQTASEGLILGLAFATSEALIGGISEFFVSANPFSASDRQIADLNAASYYGIAGVTQ